MLGLCFTGLFAELLPLILGLTLVCLFWGMAVCHLTSFGCPSSFVVPRFVLLILMCRVGEALNPGPADFVLGTFNPSGLKGKAPYVVSHLAHGDIWAVTETHLCDQSMKAFRASMHFAKGPHRYCVSGFPVPSQHNRVFHSAWRGVAVLAKHPTRAVPNRWPTGIYESSRAMITTTLVNNVWVTGATIYGEPESGAYPQQKANNEALLTAAASQVCHLHKGPRYVAGDWNVDYGTLQAFSLLENAGFVDLQDLAVQKWGIPFAPTCKEKTRKDFCFVSRELQHLLKSVQVIQDVFPDHAVLQGTFHSLGKVSPRSIWPSAKPLPWPTDWQVDPDAWSRFEGSCDDKYAATWQHIETKACEVIPFHVPAKAKGRAATKTTVDVIDGTIPPPKKSRLGDVQPHYVAASYRHAQWLRQVRRLQSYIRYAKVHDVTTAHAVAVWGSIVRATGFTPNFVTWWQQCEFRSYGAPSSIPYVAPGWQVAEHVFDTFMLAFRTFERDLFKASRSYARHRRENNPNMIFRDVGSYTSKGVDVLVCAKTTQVQEVRQDDQSLVTEDPVDFAIDKPLFCNGRELDVIHHEHDCMWVQDVESIEVGMPISQPLFLGAQHELFETFLHAWKDMWGRHSNVPAERWFTILEFARRHLPRQQFHWSPLNEDSLRHCINHKKSTTTAGLDGVTLHDLKAMPVNALQNFVAMFHHAESTGEWPTQVVAGRVTCIAKTEDPQHALDFRPITVLGLLYRCWGTYNAKNAIRCLDPFLPEGLFGSRPQRFAGQVWSQLLWTLELAYSSEMQLSGIIADIRKAFNYLPRLVVMESCALLGIPPRVLLAWAGALTIMPRRFQINGAFSPPTLSTCGLPEGCAMSCVGMIALDVVYHLWMTAFFPLCQPLSYVDDWQILVPHPDSVQPVFTCLDQLVAALDLFLDSKKTCAWSISPAGRALMRDQGFTLVAYGRNLGAHVQFTRQHTNKTLMDRVAHTGPLWAKLRASPCPYQQKVRAVLCAAWPKALHGIAATTISLATFQTLRAGAMKGLKADTAGANAHVQLGMIERANVDPQCWAILQTFRLTRDCGSQPHVEGVLAALADDTLSLPANTITHTLMHRIHTLGWHITPEGHVQDFFGPFSIFGVSMTELQYRVEFHWTQVIAQVVSHRPCFQGFSEVDPWATRNWLRALDPSDKALFRLVLNGAHITQDGKRYCQQVDKDICPYCECSDSRYHRFWECAAFEHLRAHVSPDDRQAILELPEVLTCSGWALQPTTVYEWHAYFAGMQVPPMVPLGNHHTDVHIFTDGSCHAQNAQALRFAAYSVVLADMTGLQDRQGELLDSGPVPGILQSAVRAEIFAVLRALQSVQHCVGRVMIWTDCEAVVKKFRRLLAGHSLRSNGSHSDLWVDIQQLLQVIHATIGITKVSAHQALEGDYNLLQEWCFRHNGMADRCAVAANFNRTVQFWELHKRHARAVTRIGELNSTVQSVQLAISQQVVATDKPQQLQQDPQVCELPTLVSHWVELPPLIVPPQAVRWYGDALVRRMVSWFWFSTHGSSFPMVWVSHFQLYIDYMLCTGCPGPVHLGKWKEGHLVSHLSLRGIGFKQRTKWWTKVLKETLRHQGIHLQMSYGKPCSQSILMHTGVIALPWDVSRLNHIDRWLLSLNAGTYRRQSKALDAVPIAAREASFPQVPITTVS